MGVSLPVLGVPGALGGGTAQIARQLLDQFTTDRAAGAVNGTAAEPGGTSGGVRNVVDDESKITVASGALTVAAQATPAYGNCGMYYTVGGGGVARACGRVFAQVYNFSVSSNLFGLSLIVSAKVPTAFADIAEGFFASNLANWYALNDTPASAQFRLSDIGLVTGTAYTFKIITRDNGAWYTVKGGIYSSETLVFVSNIDATATLYPGFSNFQSAFTSDDVEIYDQPTLSTQWSGVLERIEIPATGNSVSGNANGIIEFTWIPAGGETLDLYVRMSDANNAWIVRCVQAANTIQTVKLEGGGETADSTVAQTWTASTAYRIVVWPYADTIKVLVDNNLRIAKTSTFNQTASDSKAVGFTNAQNYAAWPELLDTSG